MKSVRLLTAALFAAASCAAADDAVPSAEPTRSATADEGSDATQSGPPLLVPLGVDYELFTSFGFVELRPGDTRQVTLSAADVGFAHGTWTLDSITDALPPGTTITNAPPETLDFTTAPATTFTVDITAASDATPGTSGLYETGLAPPADDDGSNGNASAGFSISIVAPDATIGPVAMPDDIGPTNDGITFDPTTNDTAGDAPLDPVSLTVVDRPTDGTLTVTATSQLTYLPGTGLDDSATYRVCDTDGNCATARLRFWRPL